MNQIEILVNKLCPNGVPSELLMNLCTIETGKLNANASTENGQYAFFTTAREISRIDHYRWNEEALLIAGNANVGDVKHYFGKFDAYQRTYVLTKFSKSINPRFLMYKLKDDLQQYLSDKTNSAAMTYIVLSTLQNFPVLLPPIEVQGEIVRILDTFTQLEAEIEAEIEARTKQYEYYRRKLLDYGETLTANKVESLPIADIFEIRNGYTPSKAKPEYWEGGTIPWIRIEDIRKFGRVIDCATQYINQSGLKSGGTFHANSIIISTLATIGEHALVTVPFVANQQLTILTIKEEFNDKLDSKFAFYYCFKLAEYCRSHTSTSGFASVNMRDFKKFPFPLPAIEVQQKVVKILDAFSGLLVELETELDARRQQYEYFRNKLLVFQELEVA